jgi:hypothetical protein
MGAEMSLRAFHLVFIVLSIVLAAFVAAWAVGQFRTGHEMIYVATAIAALLMSAGLMVYGVKFQRKTRHLVAMLLMLGVPRVALACPVCFGQSDAPMARAMNQGILLMLVVVGFVLAAFATFFISLVRRARIADGQAASIDAGRRDLASDPQEGTA